MEHEPTTPEAPAEQPEGRFGEPWDRWLADPAGTLAWAIPLLLGALIFGHALDRWRVWEAEIFTLVLARLPFGQMLEQAARDVHPPLQYIVPGFFVMLSTDDWLLRVPSGLAALAAVGLIMLIARRDLGRDAVPLAGLALATAPFAVLYAGSGRAYASMILLGLALLWASGEVARGPRPIRGAAFLGLLASLSLYTHYAMGAPLLGAALALLLGSRSGPGGRWWQRLLVGWGALFLAAISFLPWLDKLVGQADHVKSGKRTLDVLHYALWPLVRYVPLSSWLWLAAGLLGLGLLLLRARGRRGFYLAWAASLVLGPWLLSSSVDMVMRPYAHAGLLGPMALLTTAGLWGPARWLLAHRGARLAWLSAAALAVLVFHGVPIARLLILPSAPFSFSVRDGEKGVFDSEREIALLEASMVSGERIVLPGLSSPGRYRHHLARIDLGPDHALPQSDDWVGSAATDQPEGERWGAPAPETGCTLAWAFPFVLTIPSQEGCERLMSALREAAERQPHGPFLMELASDALRRGDREGAMGLAAQAEAVSPAWPQPARVQAELLLEAGDAVGAMAAARRGLVVAGRWDPEAAAALRDLRVRALTKQGRKDETQREIELIQCAQRTRRSPGPRQLCFLDVWLPSGE